MTELSPKAQALLERVVDAQEKMLYGCSEIFSGLRQSKDPEVVFVSELALEALETNRDILDAMIDGLIATHH